MTVPTLESLVQQFPPEAGVVQAKWFGKPCLNAGGKAFVVQFGSDLAFKLTGDSHAKALKIEGAHLFDPRGQGNAFKEWVQVPVKHSDQWPALAQAAYEFVSVSA